MAPKDDSGRKGPDKAGGEGAAGEGAAGEGAAAEQRAPLPTATAGPVPRTAQVVQRLDGWLGRIETAALGLLILILVGIGVYQSIASHAFDKNSTWTYEILRYSVFFIAMTGAALAAQRSRMINMDVVTRLLTPRKRAWLRVITALFVIAMCVLLYRGGMDMRHAATQRNQTYDIISETTGLLALPIGALLIGLHVLFHTIIDLTYLAAGLAPPEPDQRAH